MIQSSKLSIYFSKIIYDKSGFSGLELVTVKVNVKANKLLHI